MSLHLQLMLTETKMERCLVVTNQPNRPLNVIYTAQFMHKCFWVNTSSAKLVGLKILLGKSPDFSAVRI